MTDHYAATPRLFRPSAVLFDIDGTLVVGGNSHFRSLIHGLETVLGAPVDLRADGDLLLLDGQSIAGWVDFELWSAAARAVGKEMTPEVMAQVETLAVAHYRATVADGSYSGRVAPGAVELLDAVAVARIPYGLATGNVLGMAYAKLDAAGLATRFDYPERGGFGHQPTRAAVAAAAAKAIGADPAQTVLVGDTAGDMAAAAANGMTGIGVSFGAHSAERLTEAGAVHVVDDLADLIPLLGLR